MPSSETKLLLREARRSLRHAHSPYSGIKVGAALLTVSGRIYSGCNVENASYGGTVCAERNAICAAVASGDVSSKRKIAAILIVTNQQKIWPPCGLCRQVLAEFSSQKTRIYCANVRGRINQTTFTEIFPHAFDQKMF